MKATAYAAPDGGSYVRVDGWTIHWRNGTAVFPSDRPYSEWPAREATAAEIELAKKAHEELWRNRKWPLPGGLKATVSG